MSKKLFLREVNFIKLDCYSDEEYLYIVDSSNVVARVSLTSENTYDFKFKSIGISKTVQEILAQLVHNFSKTPILVR